MFEVADSALVSYLRYQIPIAIAPAMYQRIAPNFEFGFSEKDTGYSPDVYRLGLESIRFS